MFRVSFSEEGTGTNAIGQSWCGPATSVIHNSTTDLHTWPEAGWGAGEGGAKGFSVVEERGRLPGSSDFGTLLRRYRLAAGLSQEALAERARMSANGIGSLERGDRRTPQRETLALLVGALALDDKQRREFEAAATRPVLPRRIGGASVTVGPWADTTNSNLPFALKSFVGRDTELNEIIALVRNHRLVTLAGVGGLGKTEMALQVGRALNDSSDTTVCFVALAPISDPALLVTTIASTLGVQEVPNRPLLATLVASLKNKVLLLILDNCEHVIMHAAEVAETILSSCAHVRILATSRESLRAAGEQSYRLPSLSVPSLETARSIRATDAAAYGAILLFADRARGIDHRFALADENAPVVAELCRRLDGIPLAIELAAARVNQLSPQALAENLEDRFRILTGGERTAVPRQQTMRGTIDWSYELLSTPERRVFERLSVFAGGCALAAATTVCVAEEIAEEHVLDLLSSLVDKSLLAVDFEGSEPRYRLLESFRQYAREKLSARGEHELISHRHALACLKLAERLDRGFYYEPKVVPALIREESDNWRAALRWALTGRGDVLLGQRLAGMLVILWQDFVPVEGQRWLDSALEPVDDLTPTIVVASLRYAEASVAMSLGRYKVWLESSRAAAAHYRVVGECLGVARAQTRQAQALYNLGRFSEARPLLEEALSIARGEANRWPAGWILRSLSDVSAANGDLESARRYVAEALRSYEAQDATVDFAWTLASVASIEFRAGNPELALARANEMLGAMKEFNQPRGVAVALTFMPAYLISLDRFSAAEKVAREALAHAREHQLDGYAWNALQSLAELLMLRRREEEKPEILARAARILGFVDTRRETVSGGAGDYGDVSSANRLLAILRDELGTDAVAQFTAEGAAMTEERTDQEALGLS
jgi:predicted ATPase/transcriptional regulator with XRE-family HTH domain